MPSFFDDTPVGRLINTLSNGRYFKKPDQEDGFKDTLPASFSDNLLSKCRTSPGTTTDGSEIHRSDSSSGSNGQQEDLTDIESSQDHTNLTRVLTGLLPQAEGHDLVTRAESRSRAPPIPYVCCKNNKDIIIVDWYGPDDPENPANWSNGHKILVTVSICVLTLSVYAGSAIVTPGILGMTQEFDVSLTQGTLSLSVFIMGYAVGPLFLAPPSDVPSIGRSTPYWVAMLCLVLFNVGAAHAPNYGTHITMRLLSGMAGSPALATGGASLGDCWKDLALPKAISIWALGAVGGPVLAPVIAGWSAQSVDWRLPLYLFVALSGIGLLITLFMLPETLPANILYRRAHRLRKLTGDYRLKSQGEVDQSALSMSHFLLEGFYMPIRISLEPIVLYSSVLLGLIYAIFYCAFESVPIVYGEIYGWNTGEQTLPFLALGVFGLIGLAAYLCYLIHWFDPRFIRKAQQGIIDPEDRIILALIVAPLVLVSLFWTGWTAKRSISYWSPMIAQGIYIIPTFYLFQCIITYLAFTYPSHQASVFTANDLIRSLIASVFPIFARAIYVNLGLGKGYSLLAGLSFGLLMPMWGLFKYGRLLRRHSKYAHDYSVKPQAQEEKSDQIA